MADDGGQQVQSPYHAMSCNPVTTVDPLGLIIYNTSDPYKSDVYVYNPQTGNIELRYNYFDASVGQTKLKFMVIEKK